MLHNQLCLQSGTSSHCSQHLVAIATDRPIAVPVGDCVVSAGARKGCDIPSPRLRGKPEQITRQWYAKTVCNCVFVVECCVARLSG